MNNVFLSVGLITLHFLSPTVLSHPIEEHRENALWSDGRCTVHSHPAVFWRTRVTRVGPMGDVSSTGNVPDMILAALLNSSRRVGTVGC